MPTGDNVDRGDNFTPSAADVAANEAQAALAEQVAADKAVVDAPKVDETATDTAVADKVVDDKKVDDTAATTTDETKRDDKGRFIPKSRFDEAVQKERERAESAERKLTELQSQLEKQAQSKTEGELNTQVVELRKQKAQATLDGDLDKIVELETQIDSIRDQIAIQKSTELSNSAKSEAQENVRFDAAVASLESMYDILDSKNAETFDQDIVDIILAGQRSLMENENMSPSQALVKSAEKLLTKMGIKPKGSEVQEEPKPVDKGLGGGKTVAEDRKVAATQKNIDAAMKTPPDTRDVGLDTDKAGMKDGLPTPMSVDELKAIPEATLKRMRGDMA